MFNNLYKNKRVLVTGHTGFKGSWMTTWLLSLGAKVTGISRDIPTKPSLFEELGLEKKIDHHFADVGDLNAIRSLVASAKPDFLFHMAAQPIVAYSYRDPIETFRTNTLGTAHVLESLRLLAKPCYAVVITSDKCYDNVEWIWGYRETDALGGKDPYSASKGAAELVARSFFHSYFSSPDSPVKMTVLRAGNVIGGGDWADSRIVPDCFRAWHSGNPVRVRNPRSTRPWQHVLEPVSGYLRAGQRLAEVGSGIHGEPFNIGPAAEQNHNVLELLEAISAYWKGSKLPERFEIEDAKSFHEAGLLKLNCDKALHFLEWKPALDFAATARFTGEWYDGFYNDRRADVWTLTNAQIAEYAEAAQNKNIPWVR